jgi:hypothetical protein
VTLLRTLVSDKQVKVFFVGTTRSDGKGSTTDVLADFKLDLLGEDKDGMKDQVHTIHLGDLSLYGVTEIVSNLLGKAFMDTQPLRKSSTERRAETLSLSFSSPASCTSDG